MGFTVRVARVEDLAALQQMMRDVPEAPQWNEEAWRAVLEGGQVLPRGCVVAVDESGALVGLLAGQCVFEVAEVESVAVREDVRGMGVGRALVDAWARWACAAGAAGVEVVALEVRSANAAAVGFYRALGFVEQGRRERYYSQPVDDAVLMRATVESLITRS